MKTLVLVGTCLSLFCGCRQERGATSHLVVRTWTLSEDVQIEEIEPGVWIHTTWTVLSSGIRYPANGLLVKDGVGLLLVDTGWTPGQTEQIVDWADEELNLPVKRAIGTHSHSDRVGGAAVLASRGVSFATTPLTREFAAREGIDIPDTLALETPGDVIQVGPVEVLYPGPGHSLDNVMVWISASHLLFGGCAVRPSGTSSLGYTDEADLDEWPVSLRRAKERYRDAEVVVPGHEARGGMDLLDHTVELLESQTRSSG